jgi:fluoride exporter
VTSLLSLALGATLGATARYYLTLWSVARFGARFPYGTLAINVGGSFLLGLFLAFAASRPSLSPHWRLLVATGFCGSFTTFSTLSYDTLMLLERGQYLAGLLNIFGNVAIGLLAALLGLVLGRAVA